MITLFTTAKPFRGHSEVIQRNAIGSWRLLHPECEIILFGDDEGAAEIAREFGLCHIPDVARNEHGTPLLNVMFDAAQQIATHSVLCYVNADIILMSDLVAAVRRIPFRRFLMVGQRWDVDLDQPWDFSQPEWETRMRQQVSSRGSLHPPYGIDYFVFPRGFWGDMPPFAVGRTAWDNWLIYAARGQEAAVIDATRAVMAVHQNHARVFEGTRWAGTREYPEAKRNLELAGGWPHVFTLRDATWLLTARWLTPALTRQHLRRRWQVLPILHPRLRLLHTSVQLLGRALRAPQRVPSAIIRRVNRLHGNHP
jgi:hypothetical protein